MTTTSVEPTRASAVTDGWRSTLPIHPAAEMFPLMSPDELRTIGEDIMKNGLRSPIALWRADPKLPLYLLDGRNRLDAIEVATGKPVTIGAPSLMAGDFLACDKVIVLDSRVDPWAYAISANIHRRHLTAEDKRNLIVKLLKANPERSNNATAKIAKVDDKTVGTVRAELERRSEIPNVKARTDTKGRKQPARKQATKKKRAAPAPTAPNNSDDVLAVREAAAGHSRAPKGQKPETPTREDVGPMQAETHRLKIQIVGLKSEIDELRGTSEALDDEGRELAALLRAWDRASEPVRQKFAARVRLQRET